eukprot:TRINITY_DN4708_c0_g1_i1.p1 TRINITY_DN4708_c0_g1~~TRINITY_DN4708_c0_g1_i1.p1  ORF type:complete len:174 (+),score=11.86 TRINITY_DN4708_c0_g1_i1:81-524(+)
MSISSIIALLYLVMFLVAGVIIIICFLFYVNGLLKMVKRKTKDSKKSNTNNLIFVSCSASISLLAQCFFIIVQLVQVWEWSTIAITCYLVIVDMHTLFLLIHYSHSSLSRLKARAPKSSTVPTPKTSPAASTTQDAVPLTEIPQIVD